MSDRIEAAGEYLHRTRWMISQVEASGVATAALAAADAADREQGIERLSPADVARIKAEAWDEGYGDGHKDGLSQGHPLGSSDEESTNPYRAAAVTGGGQQVCPDRARHAHECACNDKERGK